MAIERYHQPAAAGAQNPSQLILGVGFHVYQFYTSHMGILFTNVKVLDCSGADPFPGEVLVQENRISAVSRDGEALPRDDVQVIDGGGTFTLMPGLIESHAHLSIDNTDDLGSIGRIPPEENTLIAMRNARFYLDCGITSCI